MDPTRFDALVRVFTTGGSRRDALRALGGAIVAAGSIGAPATGVTAKQHRCKRHKERCRNKCYAQCTIGRERDPHTCVCCGGIGFPCNTEADCCSTICQPAGADLLCACYVNGGSCTANAQCCSGKCNDSRCTCSPVGRFCAFNDDCCTGLACQNSRCAA
jgi:hypothetical protein